MEVRFGCKSLPRACVRNPACPVTSATGAAKVDTGVESAHNILTTPIRDMEEVETIEVAEVEVVAVAVAVVPCVVREEAAVVAVAEEATEVVMDAIHTHPLPHPLTCERETTMETTTVTEAEAAGATEAAEATVAVAPTLMVDPANMMTDVAAVEETMVLLLEETMEGVVAAAPCVDPIRTGDTTSRIWEVEGEVATDHPKVEAHHPKVDMEEVDTTVEAHLCLRATPLHIAHSPPTQLEGVGAALEAPTCTLDGHPVPMVARVALHPKDMTGDTTGAATVGPHHSKEEAVTASRKAEVEDMEAGATAAMEDTNLRDADSAVGNKTVLEKTRIRDIRCTICRHFKTFLRWPHHIWCWCLKQNVNFDHLSMRLLLLSSGNLYPFKV